MRKFTSYETLYIDCQVELFKILKDDNAKSSDFAEQWNVTLDRISHITNKLLHRDWVKHPRWGTSMKQHDDVIKERMLAMDNEINTRIEALKAGAQHE